MLLIYFTMLMAIQFNFCCNPIIDQKMNSISVKELSGCSCNPLKCFDKSRQKRMMGYRWIYALQQYGHMVMPGEGIVMTKGESKKSGTPGPRERPEFRTNDASGVKVTDILNQ